jgi:hypothetical protein
VTSLLTTIDDIRPIALSLPRAYEAIVRDRVKFRVGRIVWMAFSRDETTMGFAFPKEERDALIASEPSVYFLPRPSELRYNWCEAHLPGFAPDHLEGFIVDAWSLVVPKQVGKAERQRRMCTNAGFTQHS